MKSGNGWTWSTSLADRGHEVTVLTHPEFKDRVLAERPTDIDFHFVDPPRDPFDPPAASRVYDLYRRWQNKMYDHDVGAGVEATTCAPRGWGSLHLGSRLWRLPQPLVYGPIGGGQTAPANYRRYFRPRWPVEKARNTPSVHCSS